MKAKRKPLGFIVTHMYGALQLGEGYSPGKLKALWFSDAATLFKSRRSAMRAIKNSIASRSAWLEARQNSVADDDFTHERRYHITRVEAAR
jgi:hypothetical protein